MRELPIRAFAIRSCRSRSRSPLTTRSSTGTGIPTAMPPTDGCGLSCWPDSWISRGRRANRDESAGGLPPGRYLRNRVDIGTVAPLDPTDTVLPMVAIAERIGRAESGTFIGHDDQACPWKRRKPGTSQEHVERSPARIARPSALLGSPSGGNLVPGGLSDIIMLIGR